MKSGFNESGSSTVFVQQGRDLLKIANKRRTLFVPLRRIWGTQDRRWVHRRHHVRRQIGWNQVSSVAANLELSSQQRLRGACSETDKNFRPDNFQFRIEPRAACLDFRMARFLMDASLAPLRSRPLKVLHDIRHVDFGAIKSRIAESILKNLPRRPDEGASQFVFLITGLLAYEHNPSLGWTFAKHSLRRVLPQIAAPASTCRILQTP